MSRIVSIGIRSPSTEIEAIRIVSCLLDHGWNLDDQGTINYLPFGDKDEFSWQSLDLSQKEKFFRILAEKEKAEEIVGVVILDAKELTGGQLLIFPPTMIEGEEIRQIDFILDANRKKLDDMIELTDVSWYLLKFVPALLSSGLEISSVQWQEIL